jgi:hypothetical protein
LRGIHADKEFDILFSLGHLFCEPKQMNHIARVVASACIMLPGP